MKRGEGTGEDHQAGTAAARKRSGLGRMTGGLVAVLLGAAWLVLMSSSRNQLRSLQRLRVPGTIPSPSGLPLPGLSDPSGTAAAARMRQPGRFRRSSAAASREDDLHRFPLLVHQLAGLLQAGRTPRELWADIARLNREESGVDGSGTETGWNTTMVLESAARAAALGLSPVPLLREAAQRSHGIEATVWEDLAACVHSSERSGAPLARILGRYAHGLEAVLDARAARATALSGPKATVRVLTWLPAAGLGLGYALGVNPLMVLAQTPFGWSAAAAGSGLALAARIWTRVLVRRAAGPDPG